MRMKSMPWPIIFPGFSQEMKITHLSIYKFVRAALAAAHVNSIAFSTSYKVVVYFCVLP
jgi:hypothetical protein